MNVKFIKVNIYIYIYDNPLCEIKTKSSKMWYFNKYLILEVNIVQLFLFY